LSKLQTRTRNLGDYVASELVAHGIHQVFGFPGAAVIPIMESMVDNPHLTWVTTRNEAHASLAASATAKLTGRVSVCVATSGPGATNLITGLADAQVDGAPMLAITGMIQTWRQGRFDFQDLDAARLVGQIASYSVEVTHPQELPAVLRECLGRSQQEGCLTHIALPVDLQKFEIPEDCVQLFTPCKPQESRSECPSSGAMDAAASVVKSASNLVLAVGPGARGSGAAIEELAEKLQAPILTAFNAKGVIREDHDCLLGVLGIFGAPGVQASRDVLADADLVLAFGLRDLAPFVAGHDGIQNHKLVQCEPSYSTVTHNFLREATVVGAIDQTAQGLAQRLQRPLDSGALLAKAKAVAKAFHNEWNPLNQKEDDKSFAHPVPVLDALGKHLNKDSIVALDIGDNAIWAAQFLKLYERQRVLVSENLGVMGFCLPACIASKIAEPTSTVVGITGDGGVQMTIGEMATAVQHKTEFVLLVFNNHVLGRIQAQESHPFEVALHNPDWVALARAYGADGAVIDGRTDLDQVFRKAFKHQGSPFVIDVRMNPSTQAPVGSWNDGFTPLHYA
jgi:thiamine pyrophosphate-dependent acetolactate synthase large subunit-like protein